IFPQFRTGSTDIMIIHNLKNAGNLINIPVGLFLTEMVLAVVTHNDDRPTRNKMPFLTHILWE
ncbi:MAG: hypothetical protein RSA84_25150, partial [Acinetobacter sp.]